MSQPRVCKQELLENDPPLRTGDPRTEALLGGLNVGMQPRTSTDLVMDLVATRPRRPLVIALDGPSAAGTSTPGGEARTEVGRQRRRG